MTDTHSILMRVTYWNACGYTGGGVINDPLAPAIPDGAWNAPFLGPLWYIRNLFIMCLASPIIYMLLKKTKQYFIILTGAAWIASMLWWPNEFWQKILEALCFFSWGGYAALSGTKVLEKYSNKRMLLLMAGVVISLGYFICFWTYREFAPYAKWLNSFVMIPALLGLTYALAEVGRLHYNKTLAQSSLFIYLAHMLISPYLVKIMLSVFPISNYTVFGLYAIAIIISVLVLLCLFMIVCRMPVIVQEVLLGKKISSKK